MALGTARLCVEKRLSASRITGQRYHFVCSLESTKISDDCADVRTRERVEGWHPSSRQTFLNDMHELSVREPLYYGFLSDVWGAFTTSAIQSMTTGTSGSKNFLSRDICRFDLRLGSRGLLRDRLQHKRQNGTAQRS